MSLLAEVRAVAHWHVTKMAMRQRVPIRKGDPGHRPGDRTLLVESSYTGQSWLGRLDFEGDHCRGCGARVEHLGEQWTPRGQRAVWVHT